MSVAVRSMLIAGGLVAAVSRGPPVHKPGTQTKTKQNNNQHGGLKRTAQKARTRSQQSHDSPHCPL